MNILYMLNRAIYHMDETEYLNNTYTCIFWQRHGSRCKNKIFQNTKYCKIHKKKHQYIFENMSPKLCAIKCENDIYEILKHIYENDTYEINGEINNNSESKKQLFIIILDYLLSRKKIIEIIQGLLIRYIGSKRQMISKIHDHMYNTYLLSHDDVISRKVSEIQTWYRKYLYRKIIENNTEISENNEDPFTYDSIEEIPENCKFSYKDNKGHVYIFNAVELEYFIRKQGTWNPYTKEVISQSVINHLHIFMKYNKLKPKSDKDVLWQTSLHAFTEVSQLMEKMGFYNDVSWFNKLTLGICKNVIKIYRDLCADIPDGQVYFPFGFEISEKNYVFDFCKEIIQLFKEADEHYLLCCNFVKALALNIDDFYNNLPSWLLNIESPITFLNTENSGAFYMYVQNLLDSVSTIENEIRNMQYNNIDYYDDDFGNIFNIRYRYRFM
jgi:hypothetical protein